MKYEFKKNGEDDYSLVYKDKLVKSIKNIKKDDKLNIKLSDGNINVVVKEINNEI